MTGGVVSLHVVRIARALEQLDHAIDQLEESINELVRVVQSGERGLAPVEHSVRQTSALLESIAASYASCGTALWTVSDLTLLARFASAGERLYELSRKLARVYQAMEEPD